MKKIYQNKLIISMLVLLIFIFWHARDVYKVAGLKPEVDFIIGDYWVLSFFMWVTVCISGLMFSDFEKDSDRTRNKIKKVFLRKKSLHIRFFIISLLVGFGYLYVFQGISAPDEISHYIGSYKISSIIMGEKAVVDDGHVIVREEDYFLEDLEDMAQLKEGGDYIPRILGRELENEDLYIIKNWEKLYPRSENLRVSRQSPVRTTPLIYIPQALGITLARILDMNSIGLIFMGKVFNLIAYALIMAAAIYLLPFGKNILFAVALLPMSMHLAASMSYDTMIIALVSLFMAKVFSLAYKKEEAGSGDILFLSLLVAIFSPCKMIYSTLILSYMIIPDQKFKNKKMKYAGFALILFSLAMAMFLVNAATIESYARAGSNELEWAQAAGYTVKELIKRPVFTINMVYHTILRQGGYYHMTMIGAYLSNTIEVLDIPYPLVQAFSFGLLLLALRGEEGGNPMKRNEKLWIALLIFSVFIGALLSMFIAWTPRNADTILGVQGRYFLPILMPALFLADTPYLIRKIKNIDAVIFVFVCFNAYALIRLYSIVCLRVDI